MKNNTKNWKSLSTLDCNVCARALSFLWMCSVYKDTFTYTHTKLVSHSWASAIRVSGTKTKNTLVEHEWANVTIFTAVYCVIIINININKKQLSSVLYTLLYVYLSNKNIIYATLSIQQNKRCIHNFVLQINVKEQWISFLLLISNIVIVKSYEIWCLKKRSKIHKHRG